jgi:hypothetical protein
VVLAVVYVPFAVMGLAREKGLCVTILALARGVLAAIE